MFTTSVHFYEAALECAWFDVVYQGPCTGVNLFMTKLVAPEHERTFEERIVQECKLAEVSSLMIFSPFTISVPQRFGKLCLLGVTSKKETEEQDPFGPFYAYLYILR